MIPQNFSDAFESVKKLVDIFSQNEAFYTSPAYNEADARKDFIDKFWIALGWDVNHEAQTNPYQQEVKVERGVATSEWRKRADYDRFEILEVGTGETTQPSLGADICS